MLLFPIFKSIILFLLIYYMNIHNFQQEDQVIAHNRQVVRDILKNARFTLLMSAIILVMFFVCLFTDIAEDRFSYTKFSFLTLIKYGAIYSPLIIKKGEDYRFFTSMFLHGGVAHMMANTVFILLILVQVEIMVKNKYIYILIWFLGGMMGGMLSFCYYVYVKNEILYAVGASTSIYAIIGLFLAFKFLKVDNQEFPRICLFLIVVYCFITSWAPNIDIFGHFGSMIAGVLMGLALLEPGYEYGSREKIKNTTLAGRLACGAYILLLCVGVLAA